MDVQLGTIKISKFDVRWYTLLPIVVTVLENTSHPNKEVVLIHLAAHWNEICYLWFPLKRSKRHTTLDLYSCKHVLPKDRWQGVHIINSCYVHFIQALCVFLRKSYKRHTNYEGYNKLLWDIFIVHYQTLRLYNMIT